MWVWNLYANIPHNLRKKSEVVSIVINEHEGYQITNETLVKVLLRILLNEGYIDNATYGACIEEINDKQNKKY